MYVHSIPFFSYAIGILTNPKVILKHYLFSLYFLLDVASVLPLEVFGLAWDTDERYGYIAVFKLNRLIKIWKVENSKWLAYVQLEH